MNTHDIFDGNDRAVSPVIGVILMVAITVILAAVIGTFVLGLGDSLGDNQPTAQISVSLDEGASNATFEHNGGDSIPSGDLRVIVGNGTSQATGSGLFDSRFSVGDSATVSYGEDSETTTGAGEEIRVRLIHEPSDSVLLDRTIELNDGTDVGGEITQ